MGFPARVAPGIVLCVVAAACSAGAPTESSTVPRPDTLGSPAATGSAVETSPSAIDPRELRFSLVGWRTDFSQRSVDLAEIFSGGPGKDGIPALDHPQFESIADARSWLDDRSPVVIVAEGASPRAYPIAILVWHEIVNDTVSGQPITVTYCPLCNTALVFGRDLNGAVYDFGTTGNLRFSDLVMYDRQTESWWQQATGEAIVGTLTGAQLRFLPTQMVSLADFAAAHPEGEVLSRATGYDRPYGKNPYVGYDDPSGQPFLFGGEADRRLPAMERVVAVGEDGDGIAFPYTDLAAVGVAEATVAGDPIVVFWVAGTASPLDTGVILGRDIGSTGVFRPLAGERRLTFRREGGVEGPIVDAETRSTWSVTGLATAGPLAGAQLEPVVHGDHFWFAWAAFVPGTRIWRAP